MMYLLRMSTRLHCGSKSTQRKHFTSFYILLYFRKAGFFWQETVAFVKAMGEKTLDEINQAMGSLTPSELVTGLLQDQALHRCDVMRGCLEVLSSISHGPAFTSEEDEAMALALQCENAEMPTMEYEHPGYLEPEVGEDSLWLLMGREPAEQDSALGSSLKNAGDLERKQIDLTESPAIFEDPSPRSMDAMVGSPSLRALEDDMVGSPSFGASEDDMAGSPSQLGAPEDDMAGSPSQLGAPEDDNKQKPKNAGKNAKIKKETNGRKAKAACKKPATSTKGKNDGEKKGAGAKNAVKKKAAEAVGNKKTAAAKKKSQQLKDKAECKRQSKAEKTKASKKKVAEKATPAAKKVKMDETAVLKAKMHCVLWLHCLNLWC